MFLMSVGEYELRFQADGPPERFSEYCRRAALAEEFGDMNARGLSTFYVGAGRPSRWPSLVVVQRYCADAGFSPGALFVPETHLLFLGAGDRLLAYDLSKPSRLWEDVADVGFWAWSRHGSVILMAAELELAAWDIQGRKLWTRFVEPPWEFEVEDDVISLDVMGTKSRIDLRTGEPL